MFDTLADVEHHPEWSNPSAKLRMTSVSGGPPSLGSKYRSEQVFAGKPQTADIEIVEFDRPGRFAFAITQRKQGSTKDVRYRHTFVLTPEGGGTRLERTTASVGGNALPRLRRDARGQGRREEVAREPEAEGRSLGLRRSEPRVGPAPRARYSRYARGGALGRG